MLLPIACLLGFGPAPTPPQTVPATEALTAPRFFSSNYSARDAADIDADGDVDLLLLDTLNFFGQPFSLGQGAVYLNDGSGAFAPAPQLSPALQDPFGRAPLLGDFDGDGRIDLFRVVPQPPGPSNSTWEVRILTQNAAAAS